MSFIVRTLARTVISTVATTVVTYGVKRFVEHRNERKRAVPRLVDENTRRPAQRVKASDVTDD